jgi:hypothetical protein
VFFFLTERTAVQGSKKQHCYSNDPSFAEGLSQGTGDRESHLVDIDYEQRTDVSPAQFHLELDTPEGRVKWDMTPASEPSPEYASKLIDATEAAHDLKGGLLFFYLTESAVVNMNTQLTIGSESYPAPIWPEVSKPPYFVAHRGVHSRDVHNGYFGALSRTRVTYRSWSAEFDVGTEWQTRRTDQESGDDYDGRVRVAELDGDRAVLEEDDGIRYHVRRLGDSLVTEALSMVDDGATMQIDFDPPLPDLRALDSEETTSSFSISMTGPGTVVEGQVTVTSTPKGAEILLAPEMPEWTQRIRLRTSIEPTTDGYVYESRTEYPQTDGAE